MEILILVVFWWRLGCAGCDGYRAEVVPSPEAATVALWEHQRHGTVWSGASGKLYQINLDKGTTVEVPLPTVKFTVP